MTVNNGRAAWTLLENSEADDQPSTGRFWQASPLAPPCSCRPARRLTADVRSQLATDYEAGRSTTWLMRAYHMGKGTVLKILAAQDVRMRGQGVPEDRIGEVITFYKGGLSLKAIAARLD
jgi:hypothetical protein